MLTGTGDPECPENIRKAKRLRRTLCEDANVGTSIPEVSTDPSPPSTAIPVQSNAEPSQEPPKQANAVRGHVLARMATSMDRFVDIMATNLQPQQHAEKEMKEMKDEIKSMRDDISSMMRVLKNISDRFPPT
jgi:hypothetical protein